jgi:uncharacterized membrane protein
MGNNSVIIRTQNYGNFFRNQSFHQDILPFVTISSQTGTLIKPFPLLPNQQNNRLIFNRSATLKYIWILIIFMEKGFKYKKLLQYFLQGLLVLAPITITAYALYFVVSTIDGWIPIFTHIDEQGVVHVQNYGVGFVLIILVLILIGYFSSFFITGRILSFMDKLMQKTPGLKHIYSTTRDFFEAFAGDKKKFTQNVLANVDDNDVWRMGFITRNDMSDFGLKDFVAVYIPMAYSVAGNVYIIPKSRIKPINNISSAQTMKFAVSGGVTHVEDEDKDKQG